jgi:S1-C subfamily serine protease
MFTRVLTLLALALTATAPVSAQQAGAPQQSRREVEDRMRELERELRELQRRLNEINRREGRITRTTPRVWSSGPIVTIAGNRARLGVNVRPDRSTRVDTIGAELLSVTPGGPAEQAGLRSGDIITMFNGERLVGRYPAAGEDESEPAKKLVDFARELEDGDTVEVQYRRGNETRRATIVARELEPEDWYGFVTLPRMKIDADRIAAGTERMARDMASGFALAFSDRWLFDMELVALNPELGEYFGTTEGLLVVRAPRDGSLNLKAGDVILRIGGRTPASQASVARILRSYDEGETVEIEIMREKRRMTVTGTMPERGERFDHEHDGGHDWEHGTHR